MNVAEALGLIRTALAAGEELVEVVVTASGIPGVEAGSRLLVWEDRVAGGLGDADLHEAVVAAAREAIRATSAGSRGFQVPGGRCTVYLEPHRPVDDLVILGAGHIARPLCRLGVMLGYRVTVLDDRAEYATRERFEEAHEVRAVDSRDPFRDIGLSRRTRLVLVTRGHRHDFEALRVVLKLPEPPEYIGMVGSRRRVRATLEQLVREGTPRERLRHVYAPIGLDLGAETPEEIAVAIAAELVRLRRSGTGESLRDRARVLERCIEKD